MIIGLQTVLTPGDAAALAARLLAEPFADGKATAGWHARQVKNNSQLTAGPVADAARGQIEAALRGHQIFASAAMPKAMQLMINLYAEGQSYGRHVDDAFMAGMRTDVALTLFLSDPASYDGGELVIETASGEQAVKLPAGAAIVYPATTLHRVNPVTRGRRLACVGWVESRVRDVGEREILFDLDRARRSLFEANGKTAEFDLISKAMANLMRRWGE
jgi:PKHD-type hydroxylase